MRLVILTGASGSGKTTIAERIERQHPRLTRVFRFDSIGVPSPEERIARWGAESRPGGGWQRAMTIEWLARIAREIDTLPVLFEGQMRLSFITDGLTAAGIARARIVLVHCDDESRTHRLVNERNQPDLANPDMMNWARFLRGEAEAGGFEVLDTSKISIEDSVEYVCERLGIGRSGGSATVSTGRRA
ncbi:ATP-binding protein [Bradyrhizobium sp. WYCCWR 13023]|uniref:ATP-binding protein n=1 Tax=Bradyrhizobium zhengyangense TaxID=2911009 RepID=A0A9X1UBM9_9BRAD|nr:ATP-binding protein [Bradyrhizobium zhengyangense]MCG2629173.1 ATP-binding protein [Bradyrhizobium zhengyangense]MCG2670686.1 ATP-binding protein [Bradyrhizobium zhengyangense]